MRLTAFLAARRDIVIRRASGNVQGTRITDTAGEFAFAAPLPGTPEFCAASWFIFIPCPSRMPMSLHPQEIAPIPEETRRVANAAFPKGSIYLRMRDQIGTIFNDPMFAPLFPIRGQPAESPWRLALIMVMQFVEGLSDRQAADAVRCRIDWKYALSLDLNRVQFENRSRLFPPEAPSGHRVP
jgi:Transposase domain (DUF772)